MRIARTFTVTCYWGPTGETASLFGKQFEVFELRARSPRAAASAVLITHCLGGLPEVPSGYQYDPSRADGAFIAVARHGETYGYVLDENEDGLRLLGVESTRKADNAAETIETFEILRSVYSD